MLLCAAHKVGANLLGRIKLGAGRFVLDQFNTGNQSDTPHFTNHGVAGESPQPLLQAGRNVANMSHDVPLFVDG